VEFRFDSNTQQPRTACFLGELWDGVWLSHAFNRRVGKRFNFKAARCLSFCPNQIRCFPNGV
jgi:hypothetical protein